MTAPVIGVERHGDRRRSASGRGPRPSRPSASTSNVAVVRAVARDRVAQRASGRTGRPPHAATRSTVATSRSGRGREVRRASAAGGLPRRREQPLRRGPRAPADGSGTPVSRSAWSRGGRSGVTRIADADPAALAAQPPGEVGGRVGRRRPRVVAPERAEVRRRASRRPRAARPAARRGPCSSRTARRPRRRPTIASSPSTDGLERLDGRQQPEPAARGDLRADERRELLDRRELHRRVAEVAERDHAQARRRVPRHVRPEARVAATVARRASRCPRSRSMNSPNP